MPNSCTQTIYLNCPKCNHQFTSDIYNIVDIVERPDLLERIMCNTLHDIPCPQCDYKYPVDQPLLVFRPNHNVCILVSSSKAANEGISQQQSAYLIEKFKESSEHAWQDIWLENALIVRRDLLPVAVSSNNPVDAMTNATEQEATELEMLRSKDPDEYLRRMMHTYLDAHELDRKRQTLENTPELLSDQAEVLLKNLLEKSQKNKSDRSIQISQEDLDFLVASRADGVSSAFDQVMEKRGFLNWVNDIRSKLSNSLGQPSDAPRRIDLRKQVLEKIERETHAELWGEFHCNLALDLIENPEGIRAENIEQAILHYNKSLEVFTRQKFPKEWALVQNNLAQAYLFRVQGEKSLNSEQAILHYNKSLGVFKHQSFPKEWALAHENLAIVFQNHVKYEKGENLELAIEHYRQAQEVFTHQACPEKWATIQNNLALVYMNRTHKIKTKNFEQAIRICQTVLEKYNVKTSGNWRESQLIWATTKNYLARAYMDRTEGNKEENLEQAIQFFHASSNGLNRREYPVDWAAIQVYLAEIYIDRIFGETGDNIELAIQHNKRALEIYTRQDFPEKWALGQQRLAYAFGIRIVGERAKNVEHAIQHYQKALEVLTLQKHPDNWANIQRNLAIIYINRIKGKKEENIEQAIEHYILALNVYRRNDFPHQWAEIHILLADANINRPDGGKTEKIEQAIQYCKLALEVFKRDNFPHQWAKTHLILGNASKERSCGGKTENIERAIQYYRQALEVYTRQAFPQEWANIQICLARAQLDPALGRKPENVNQAIVYLNHSLEVYTCHEFPEKSLEGAIILGDLACYVGNWELAKKAYDQAISAKDVLMRTSFSYTDKASYSQAIMPKGKLLQGDPFLLPHYAAYVNVQVGEDGRAVELLEQSRAQLMREGIEHRRNDLEQLPGLGFENLYDKYKKNRNELFWLARERYKSEDPTDWITRTKDSLKRAKDIENSIREEVGGKYPQFRYFMQPLPFDEIQKLSEEQPLVYLSITSMGGIALIVTKQGVKSVKLPKIDTNILFSKVWPIPSFKDELTRSEIMTESLGGYLSTYYFATTPSWGLEDNLLDLWKSILDAFTHWLWDVIMGDLFFKLKEYCNTNSVVIIPTGLLSALPLHAAWIEDQNRPTGRWYALDEINISYAPSAHALWNARLAVERPCDTLMVVDNPDGTLIFSEHEVKAVLDHFDDSVHLTGKNGNLYYVGEKMKEAHVLHFSTHGGARLMEPGSAYLKLQDKDLDVSNFFYKLDQSRLAILSACETSMPGIEMIDEMIGLPSKMMQAGVPGVIGSLWTVNDMSTAILMARFYFLWREKKHSPQDALHQAQIWLRDTTAEQKKKFFKSIAKGKSSGMKPDTAKSFYTHLSLAEPGDLDYSSPYYWAAFTYTGV